MCVLVPAERTLDVLPYEGAFLGATWLEPQTLRASL